MRRQTWFPGGASDLRRRLAMGTAWSLVGAVGSRALTLVAGLIAARLLGQDAFGRLGMLQTTLGMVASFAGFGLGLTATRSVAQLRSTDPARAGRIVRMSEAFALATGVAMALALVVAAPELAVRFLHDPAMALWLRWASPMLVWSAWQGAQQGALSGFEAFKATSVLSLINGGAGAAALVLGAASYGIAGALAGLMVQQGGQCVANAIVLHRVAAAAGVPLRWSGWWAESGLLWTSALPAGLSGLFVGPVNWYCSALLSGGPDGYAELAALTAANQYYNCLLFLPNLLGQVVLPLLAQADGVEAAATRKRVLRWCIRFNGLVVLPAAAALAACSPWLMSAFGSDYGAHWPTLVVTVATAWVLSIQIPVGQLIAGTGQMWLGSAMNVGWAIVFVAAARAWSDSGALGVAGARLVAYIAHAAWVLGYAAWLLRERNRPVNVEKALGEPCLKPH
jgi:O-antigen/teichoic acid export membrane protein